ncbi:hypothetical protein AB0K43_01965 [Kitasatospora sp. NPDC049258]|uniref:hypothetical protein n=1 Tax=Kitasatospora sp. NPDC049258 TaxID=3155394 RepID=UPI00342E5255
MGERPSTGGASPGVPQGPWDPHRVDSLVDPGRRAPATQVAILLIREITAAPRHRAGLELAGNTPSSHGR